MSQVYLRLGPPWGGGGGRGSPPEAWVVLRFLLCSPLMMTILMLTVMMYHDLAQGNLNDKWLPVSAGKP